MASYVPLTLATGATILVQPETVDELQDTPLDLITTPPGPPCSYLSLLDGSRFVLTGTAAANAALLAAGSPPPTPVQGGTFAPTVAITGGPIALAAGFLWNLERVGSTVTLSGRIDTTWSSNGVGTLSVTVPLSFASPPNVRGVVSATPNPLAAGPFTEAGAVIRDNGANLEIEVANSVGAPLPLRLDVVVQYQTP